MSGRLGLGLGLELGGSLCGEGGWGWVGSGVNKFEKIKVVFTW